MHSKISLRYIISDLEFHLCIQTMLRFLLKIKREAGHNFFGLVTDKVANIWLTSKVHCDLSYGQEQS